MGHIRRGQRVFTKQKNELREALLNFLVKLLPVTVIICYLELLVAMSATEIIKQQSGNYQFTCAEIVIANMWLR